MQECLFGVKKSAQLIISARGPPIPNLVEIHSLGDSGQMGEIALYSEYANQGRRFDHIF